MVRNNAEAPRESFDPSFSISRKCERPKDRGGPCRWQWQARERGLRLGQPLDYQAPQPFGGRQCARAGPITDPLVQLGRDLDLLAAGDASALTARLDDGRQLDVTFVVPAAAVDAFDDHTRWTRAHRHEFEARFAGTSP